MNGRLRLKAERIGDRTALTDAFRTAPFHLGQPSDRNGDGGIEVIIQEVGPGLFPGDTTETDVEVGPGARLTIRGQAATKLYPCPWDACISSSTWLRVHAGGRLVHLPGELIPFRDADLSQHTHVDVEAGGQVALAEIVTPGRLAMGEFDAYRRLTLRLNAQVDGRLVLTERTRLDPAHGPAGMLGRRGEWACMGMLWLIGFGAEATSLGQSGDDAEIWWASGGDDIVTMVRCLGPTAQGIRELQHRLLAGLVRH